MEPVATATISLMFIVGWLTLGLFLGALLVGGVNLLAYYLKEHWDV